MRIKWFSLIRVTGILLVLLYHFFQTPFSGGFIGVDLFFTFSGYLITALLVDEYTSAGKIDLLAFYRRRLYRIVPPVMLMILVTMPFTFLVRQDYVADIGRQIASVIGFTTNFYEIITGGSYESQFISHLFVHTWSLAIEVHFYLIWAFLIWLLAKKQYHANQFRSVIFMLAVAFFGISFLSLFIRAFFVTNFSVIYFSTLSHSFPFFLGAVFATLTGIKEVTVRFKRISKRWSKKRAIGTMLGMFVLLAVLTVTLKFDQLVTYLFGFLLSSLFGSVMIYAARVLHEQTPDRKEPAIITYISDISYGLYLFHWPFYVIFSQLGSNGLAVFLTMVFSTIFATLSFYVIEPLLVGKTPQLFGLPIVIKPYRKWVYAVGVALAVVTCGRVVFSSPVGNFETELLVSSLEQSQANLNRTHTVTAGDANALSDVSIIGDSVALRSSDSFTSLLPNAQLDASVSRGFEEAFEIFQNQIDSNTLSQTTVIAIGVNSLTGYQEELQKFIDALPDGYRLIFVTPYNANNESAVKEMRDYEMTLAEQYSYVTIADWYTAAKENTAIWAGTDGVHYSMTDDTGATLYVQTIQTAIQESAKKAAKGDSESE